eukprot:429051_1
MSGFHDSESTTLQNLTSTFKCQFCYLEFNNTDSLIRHLTESHPLSCSTTNSEQSFSIPKTASQSSSSNYQPVGNDIGSSDGPPCGESLDTRTKLTDCGERQLQCAISDCQRSFKSQWDLKHHQITHSGTRLTDDCDTRPLECNSDDKTFIIASNFTHHQHKGSEERPFQCDISNCNMSFKSRRALKNR